MIVSTSPATKTIASVCSVVTDFVFQANSDTKTNNRSGFLQRLDPPFPTGKIEREWSIQTGGSGVNILRQLQSLKSTFATKLIPLIGSGHECAALSARLAEEFRRVCPVYVDSPVRRSVIVGDQAFCNRPRISLQRLPDRASRRLENSDFILVGPFRSKDKSFVEHLLGTNRNSVLQMSKEQLSGAPVDVFDLMSRALLVAMNREELQQLSQISYDPVQVIHEIHRQTGTDLLITAADHVEAMFDGQFFSQRCFQPQFQAVRHSSAGDVLLATFVEARCNRELPVERALFFAAAAACRHVSGLPQTTLERLEIWAQGRRFAENGAMRIPV